MLDVSLIADLPPFKGIGSDALKSFVEQGSCRHFNKNSTVFAADEEAHSFFLLLDGYVRVVRITPEGEQIIARYIPSGELFGIAPALGYKNYPANAVCAVDCLVLSWPVGIWQDTVERYPGFATNTYKSVGERLQETQDRIVEMATERVEHRVATAILKLANQTGRKTEEGIQIDFPVSRQDISEMTGTTLHTVSRLLSAWEQIGLIKSGRKKIIVTEGHKLLLLANNRK